MKEPKGSCGIMETSQQLRHVKKPKKCANFQSVFTCKLINFERRHENRYGASLRLRCHRFTHAADINLRGHHMPCHVVDIFMYTKLNQLTSSENRKLIHFPCFIYFQINRLDAKMKAKPHCWWYFVVILATIGKWIWLTFTPKQFIYLLFTSTATINAVQSSSRGMCVGKLITIWG